MGRFLCIVALVSAIGLGPATADSYCRVPLADWQPREALRQKLEAEGWTVETIRAHDGCYRVRAINGTGERLEARFDPSSLQMVSRKGEHGRSQHDRDDD